MVAPSVSGNAMCVLSLSLLPFFFFFFSFVSVPTVVLRSVVSTVSDLCRDLLWVAHRVDNTSKFGCSFSLHVHSAANHFTLVSQTSALLHQKCSVLDSVFEWL